LIGKTARWLWPLVFLFPLPWIADRYCWFPLTDPIYHTILALHERLPLLVGLATIAAIVSVSARITAAHARISEVLAFAVPTPEAIVGIFAEEAWRLRLSMPLLAYLAVDQRLCFALAGRQPRVVLSRGFLSGLSSEDIRLVARHELLHIRFHDPLRRLAWRVVFAALLFPAFDELERWLTARREQRVNLLAGGEDPDRYASLLVRCAHRESGLCSDDDRPARRKNTSGLVAAPLLVGSLLFGLFASHAAFMKELGYLTRHHC
jgi:Zn-dependent protease with chaperone function